MFEGLSLWTNVALFVVAALFVWRAGTRVARYADRIERITGAGEALVGMLLLGFITALPELGVTMTASYAGNAPLAVNNLLGGMALNVAILAAADVMVPAETLSSRLASVAPLLQGVLLVLLLAVVAIATLAGDVSALGIGAWSWAILALYLFALWQVRVTRGRSAWVPGDEATAPPEPGQREEEGGDLRAGALAARTAAGAAVILVAGYVLAQSGDALAEQTGLGAGFFGAVFLALATSLPEITIVFSAVRLGRYAMAMSNIFGANLFGLAMIFLVDLVYRGEPVLGTTGPVATFAALLGVAVTALFLAGLLERRHRMVLRMGVDSIAVVGAYFAGIALLYRMR